MIKAIPSLVLMTASVLVGCALGPDYVRPDTPEVSQYVSGESLLTTAVTPGPDGKAQRFEQADKISRDWYRLFHSEQLNDLIQQALNNSPTVDSAQARLRGAQEELKATSGQQFPQLDVGAGVSRNRATGAAIGLDNPLFVNTFNLYTVQASLTYNLDVFGGVKRSIESRQALVDFQRNSLLSTYLTLVNNVASAAITEAGIQAQISATQDIIGSQQDQLQLLEAEEKLGAISLTDVLRARSQLATTRALLPPQYQQLDEIRHQLAILTGVTPVDYHAPSFTLEAFDLPEKLPVSLPTSLARQRPDILASESLLHAANAEVGIATTRLYPVFNLTANYGRDGLDFADLADPPAAIWKAAYSVAAPVFRGGTLRAERRAAFDTYQQALADYQQTVLVAFSQVADTLRALDHDADSVTAQYEAMEAAAQTRELVQQQFKNGAANYLDGYIAEQQYDQARLMYVMATVQRYQDTAALFRVLGGGWWNSDS